jgi:hypothetical protein
MFHDANVKLIDINLILVAHVVDMFSLNPVDEVLNAVALRSSLALIEVTFRPFMIKKLFIVPVPKVIGDSS